MRQSLNERLLDWLVADESRREEHSDRLEEALESGDPAGLERVIRSLLAGIPYRWHTRNNIADYEGYYATVFYSYFLGLGVDVRAEESVSGCVLDMAVLVRGRVYLFEFKVCNGAPEGAALAQMKERRYAEKYRHLGEPIHLVGVEFDSTDRNVAVFETELA